MPRDIIVTPSAGQHVVVNPVGDLKITSAKTSSTRLTARVIVDGVYVEPVSTTTTARPSVARGVANVPSSLAVHMGPRGVSLADYGGNWASAIAAAPSSGNRIRVPAGTWPIATRITMYSGLTIVGAGATSTFVPRSSPQTDVGTEGAGSIFRADGATDCTITDLTIRGYPTASGTSDDIGIWGNDATRLTVQRVNIEDMQGAGIYIESIQGSSTLMNNALIEDVTITNTMLRSNGFHGVGFWMYHGASYNTVRRLTIDGADVLGLTMDAGTTVGTAYSADYNTFEDILIKNVGRTAAFSYGVLMTGGDSNTFTNWTIRDLPANNSAALAFGFDQSGLGSDSNTFTNGLFANITSTELVSFGGQSNNVLNTGTGTGIVRGAINGNVLTNWTGTLDYR